MNVIVNEHKLQELAGAAVFHRGKAYWQHGMVKDCEFKDGILSGHVQGSEPQPYKVKIYFRNKDTIHPECTCPYDWGMFCKHSVALLLQWSREDQIQSVKENRWREDENTEGMVNEFIEQEPSAIQESPEPEETFPWQKKISSFLFPSPSPVIRIEISSVEAVFSNNGAKIKVSIFWKNEQLEFDDLDEIMGTYGARYHHPEAPALAEFNTFQQHCLNILHTFQRREYPEGIWIKNFQLALLLNEAAGEGIEFWEKRKKRPIAICRDKVIPIRLRLGLTQNRKLRVTMILLNPDDRTKVLSGYFIQGRPIWLFDDTDYRFLPFDKDLDYRLLLHLANRETIVLQEQIPDFFHTVLSRFKTCCELEYQDPALQDITLEPQPVKMQLHLDYMNNKVFAKLKAVYPAVTLSHQEIFSKGEFFPIPNSALRWLQRDIHSEKKLVHRLMQECRFELVGQKFRLSDPDHIFDFVYSQLSLFNEQCEVYYSEAFQKIYKEGIEFSPEIRFEGQGMNWFYFRAAYRAEGIEEEFSHQEIRSQLMKGKPYIRLKTGEMIPIAKKTFERVERLMEEYDDPDKELPAFQIPFLMEETKRNDLNVTFDQHFRQRWEELRQFRSLQGTRPPEKLKNILRDYQKKGLDWLEFLRRFQFGGILADEMGLGKTLQVLAMLWKQKEEGIGEPSLVVCPTTLVWNWQAEVKKFLPDFKTLIVHGPDRRQYFDQIKEVDLVITSYGTLRRDVQLYQNFQFHYIILDEAQNIKNRHTLNARVSKQLNSRYRLVLTGTPLENSIADVWSIFDFLMPGFLGKYERFRQRYELPILKENDGGKLETLGRKIQPFLLRRLKTAVIKELPPKIEQVSFCELESLQQRAYKQMLQLAQKDVLTAYQAKGFERSRMMILTALLRLRQICCHPELAGLRLGHRLSISAKLNLLKELIGEVVSGGRKVIIFSQFVEMLKIIGDYLTKEKIIFEHMDGRTKDRQTIVERFNADPERRVFLLSLKVGGVGLNLTSADTVILYEPWWNPAVEDQAIDRVHRIGQSQTVSAYRLITKGTIEEKIMELQKRKKNLIDSLIVSEKGIAKKLGWEEIKFLLEIEE